MLPRDAAVFKKRPHKNAANMGNQFDLGITLPEYDFLQGVESKTKQIVENIKDWFKEALPWIEAVGAAIGAVFVTSKINNFIGLLKNVGSVFSTLGNIISGKFGKSAQIFGGIAGGLAAGATSGVLFYNGIKNLITGTGKLDKNIGMLAGGLVVAGGAIAAFIALGNPVGAVITGVVAGIGAIAGVVKGLDENIQKMNDEMAASLMFNNGGTKISEIADAFGEWADNATALNRQTIDKYNQLDEYDTKIDSVLQTMQEITGINVDFSGITPADAEALKEPFNQLATYLKEDFEKTAKTVVQDLEGIFAGANIAQPLIDQMTKGYQEMIDLFGSNIDKAQSTVDMYLDKIAANGSLTALEQADFQKNYQMIMETANAENTQNLFVNEQNGYLFKMHKITSKATKMQRIFCRFYYTAQLNRSP